jgi:YVTN family beta-propeller protein
LRHVKILEDSGMIESYIQRSNLGAPDRKYYKLNSSFNIDISISHDNFTIRNQGITESRYKETDSLYKKFDKLNSIALQDDNLKEPASQNVNAKHIRQKSTVSLGNFSAPYNIIRNIRINGVPDAVTVNPNTHIVYVADGFYGTVHVIDSKCISNGKNCSVLPVKLSHNNSNNITEVSERHSVGTAVNPGTNMVYTTNEMSNTVSVINGETNRTSVSINFNTNPKGSGVQLIIYFMILTQLMNVMRLIAMISYLVPGLVIT